MPLSHTHRVLPSERLPLRRVLHQAALPLAALPLAALSLPALRLPALLLVAIVAGGGCDLGFYWQASGGQWEILRQRSPIEEVLADPQVDPATKAKLRLVLEVQTFGTEQLALPADGHYTDYADLGRPQVSWLVVASERLALRPVEHCFFIVGCLTYKGYFERTDADALAVELAAAGYDVLVRPVRAYSTLGWFDDPVLNTFITGSDLEMMGTILHEQAHRVLFVEGDTAFNESFAMFVEREGLRQFLLHQEPDGTVRYARYLEREADAARFRDILHRGRERLEAIYASGIPEPEMLLEKAAAFTALREDYEVERDSFTLLNYDGWFAQPLNNAYLVSVSQYESHSEAFAVLFLESGAVFADFYEAARALGELAPAARAQRLDELNARAQRLDKLEP